MNFRRIALPATWLAICTLVTVVGVGQGIKWSADGNGFYKVDHDQVIRIGLPRFDTTVIVSKAQATATGATRSLLIRDFSLSADANKVLIYTNTKKVWRLDTRGDYWVFDRTAGTLKQIGKSRPPSSLMFAKISPDGTKAAYVSQYNLYVEDLATGNSTALTTNGNRKFINGTFDWAYEEEFLCRDGFRWSPDSKRIAFWQIDARKTKDYLMIDNTDSIYPSVEPVEYPVAGEPPSPYRIGVVDVTSAQTQWMDIPTDTVLQTYLPRMDWAAGNSQLILQQLNRKQNESNILLGDVATGKTQVIYHETDSAWIDIFPAWDNDYDDAGWDWLSGGSAFLWASEKDGWRHLYRVGRDGKESLITNGNYDVMDIAGIDERGGYVYFLASPENATQKYLYRTKLDGRGKLERLSPQSQAGTHGYTLSSNCKYAWHTFSNYYTPNTNEWVTVPDHKGLKEANKVDDAIAKAAKSKPNMVFFKVKSEEGVEMDAWMMRPDNFDSTKKYPVVFYVYTEPWGQNVVDEFGIGKNYLYQGDMAKDGYLYISIDNRGTPVPKGRAWRKAVYRNIGTINIRDQAMAAKEILKWKFIDTSRVGVWGWSGGGTATLNLMFQYPDIYKTGVAVAAVGNMLTYDNIYQERYMGLPQETRDDYVKGSPITYAKNLKGNLLYIHGTGDDNVHYNNSEMLINELIKYNKNFQMMSYPNRSHGIFEGEGTLRHLYSLYTRYLREHCPPGPVTGGAVESAERKKAF